MSKDEDKKSISTIEVIKKTEKISQANDEQIGVEADIPMEVDEPLQSGSIFSDLKVNEGIVVPKKVDEKIDVEPQPLSDNIKVFNISSGKVIETKAFNNVINQEPKNLDNELDLNRDAGFHKQSREKSSTIKQHRRTQSKLVIVLVGIVIFLIVFFFLLKNICTGNRNDALQAPSINLPK